MKKVIGDTQVLIKDEKTKFGYRETKYSAYKRKINTEDPIYNLYIKLLED